MGPLASTIVSSIFLAAGGIAMLTMLFVQGRPVGDRKKWVLAHRVAGYVFIGLYLLMFGFMISRVEDFWESSSPRDSIHITLATAVLALIAIKFLIARYLPRLLIHLVGLGIMLYTLSFTLVGVTAGYYIVWTVQGSPYVSHDFPNTKIMDLDLGKQLFIQRCSTCHVLNQIMRPRTPQSWESVVNKMVDLARPRITPDEAAQIMNYTIVTLSPKNIAPSAGHDLVTTHCLPCHQPTEIFSKDRTAAEWRLIVNQMSLMAPEHVPGIKIEYIINELVSQERAHSQPDPGPPLIPPATGPASTQ